MTTKVTLYRNASYASSQSRRSEDELVARGIPFAVLPRTEDADLRLPALMVGAEYISGAENILLSLDRIEAEVRESARCGGGKMLSPVPATTELAARLAVMHLVDVYKAAGTVLTGKGRYTTVNELTDQKPATRPATLLAAAIVLLDVHPMPVEATVVLSEEDKGAVLAGMFSVMVGLPLAMARHAVAYEIPGSIVVSLSMEYMDSRLTVNGLKRGDKAVIIDDTLASGGTMIALVEAIRLAGADVVDIRVVVEKLGYGGRERVLQATGLHVHAGIGISVNDAGIIAVTEVRSCPLSEWVSSVWV